MVQSQYIPLPLGTRLVKADGHVREQETVFGVRPHLENEIILSIPSCEPAIPLNLEERIHLIWAITCNYHPSLVLSRVYLH